MPRRARWSMGSRGGAHIMQMHDVRPAVGEVDAMFLPWRAWSRGRSIHTSGQQLNSIATCLNLRFGDARYDVRPKGEVVPPIQNTGNM